MRLLVTLIILLTTCSVAQSQNLIPYRKGNKWGYANKQGQIKIKPKYDEAGEFLEKITWVKKNGKYAYINQLGCRKTRFIFDEANYFGFGTAFVKKGNKKYCINLKGRKTTCVMGCGGVITNQIYFWTYKLDNKKGILLYHSIKNEIGQKEIKVDSLPAIWDEFHENYSGLAAVRKGELWGIIDIDGNLIVDYIYDEITVQENGYRTNKFFKIKKNGKYGFLNENAELITPPIYYQVDFFTSGHIAKVWIDENFWGYIDESGREYFKKE